MLLPNQITLNLESIIKKFWWGSNAQTNRIHFLSRDALIQLKSVGGLGLMDLEAFNKALLAKQMWRVYNRPNSPLAKLTQIRQGKH